MPRARHMLKSPGDDGTHRWLQVTTFVSEVVFIADRALLVGFLFDNAMELQSFGAIG